jgi:hypothetical protein
MNRITVFADIAGLPTRESTWSHRITSAGVALPTADINDIRQALPPGLTKWRDLDHRTARIVVDLLCRKAVAISAVSMNKNTPAWETARESERVLQDAIARQSGGSAGWVKLPVVLVYELLGRAHALALAHFLRSGRPSQILNQSGLKEIECALVCDEEISGQENIDVFKAFWDDGNVPVDTLASFGYRVRHPAVTITTDDAEPLLRLPDVVAGLVHSAYMPDPGRVPMPICCDDSRRLLELIQRKGILVLNPTDYSASYDRIFGDAMSAARGAGGL